MDKPTAGVARALLAARAWYAMIFANRRPRRGPRREITSAAIYSLDNQRGRRPGSKLPLRRRLRRKSTHVDTQRWAAEI